MTDVMKPEAGALSKIELRESAVAMVDRLLDEYSAVEVAVMVKRGEERIKAMMEYVRPKMSISSKKESVMGAEVSESTVREWEYHSPTLERLEAQKKEIAEKIKAHQKALQAKTGTIVDEVSGEIESAELVREGIEHKISIK